jgi:hypothetical protein
MRYESIPERRAQLISGWKQFKADLAAYVPVAEDIKPTGNAIMELPTLNIQISGGIKDSNLAVYKESALSFINNINTDLQTDEDFANAEETVKFCDKAEKQLKVVKQQALSQTADIDELFRTVDQLSEAMAKKRITLTKLVKSQKDALKAAIRIEADKSIADHIEAITKSLGDNYLPFIENNLKESMKNKRTITSLKSAANDEVARVKMAVSAIAEKIRANLKTYEDNAAEFKFLFNDLKSLVIQDSEHFALTVTDRIDKHQKAEAVKQESEREKIRQEEEAKAEQKAKKKAEEEREKIRKEEAAKLLAESKKETEQVIDEEEPKIQQTAADKFVETVEKKDFSVVPPSFLPTETKKRVLVRPMDSEIIGVIAVHYQVHEQTAIQWLHEIDFIAESDRLEKTRTNN